MPRDKEVQIRHEETGLESTCLSESLPAWERAGWTLVDDGSSDAGEEKEDLAVSYPYNTRVDGPVEGDAPELTEDDEEI